MLRGGASGFHKNWVQVPATPPPQPAPRTSNSVSLEKLLAFSELDFSSPLLGSCWWVVVGGFLQVLGIWRTCGNRSHYYKGIKSNPSSGWPEPRSVGQTTIRYVQMGLSSGLVWVVEKI